MKIPCEGCGSPEMCQRFSCAADPETCPASGGLHTYGPNGPGGSEQCAYCGNPPNQEAEVDQSQRRTFWRVIAGLWIAGGAMLYSVYRYLFRGDGNGKHDRD